MGNHRRSYTREFKLETVRVSQERGIAQTELAKELGIRSGLPYRWKRELQSDSEQAFPGNGSLKERDREMEQFRKQGTRLKAENAFLEKVSECFVKDGK